jgi:hypothetical protein
MPKVETVPNPKLYSNNVIDFILTEPMSLTAYEEVVNDISFEWLLEYSQVSLEELA